MARNVTVIRAQSLSPAEEISYGSFPQGAGVVIPVGTNSSATFPENEAYGCETCGGSD